MTVKPCVVDQVPVPPRQKRWKNRARWAGRVATAYGIRRKVCAVGQDSEPPGTGSQEDRAQWQCFRGHREKRTRKTVRGPAFRTSVTGMSVKVCEVVRQSSYRVRNPQKSVRSGSELRTFRYRAPGRPCAVAMLSWPPREKSSEDRARWTKFQFLRDRKGGKNRAGRI